jgi:hypothetical protein
MMRASAVLDLFPVFSRREARAHALIFAAVGWIGVGVFLLAGQGDRSIFGPMKWGDFVHFYTIGRIALDRDVPVLYDADLQHARQVALVPASDRDLYVAPYPPQTAMLLAPFSRLTYHWAAVAWALTTLAVYGWAVWLAWRPGRAALHDTWLVGLGALAFPPLWHLVANGQSTAVPILAFVLSWLALERDRPFLAGVALGLLVLKPQFGIVIAALAILTGNWRLIIGGLVCLAAQLGLVALWLGPAVIWTYVSWVVWYLPGVQEVIYPRPYLLHSLQAMTRVLPGSLSLFTWAFLSALVIWWTWRLWRVSSSWRVKMGALVLASVLVNPHVYAYDLSVLVLPGLWLGGWFVAREAQSWWFWRTAYALIVACLFPTAAFLPVQLSVILMAYLFWQITRRALAAAASESGDA